VGLPDGEAFVGLLHLGRGRGAADAPEREPPSQYVSFLE
jgi:hypothetical protein